MEYPWRKMAEDTTTIERVRRAFRSPAKIQEEKKDKHPDSPTSNGNSRPSGAESREGKYDGDDEPQAVGFWHPGLRQVRNRAFAKWTVTTAFLMAFILAVLSIYWGVFLDVQNRLHHLAILVVDFDGVAPYDQAGTRPFVGPTITELVQKTLNQDMPTLGWDIRSASEYNNDPLRVRQAVYDFKAWAAIIVNPNATAMLYSAVTHGNASYDPRGACQLVYQGSRDDTNWFNFIAPTISKFQTEAQTMVGKQWTSMVLQNASNPATLSNMQNAPQALSPAIGFSEFNLRPFYPHTSTPAVSIGLICKHSCHLPSPSHLNPHLTSPQISSSSPSSASPFTCPSTCNISRPPTTRLSSSPSSLSGAGSPPYLPTSCSHSPTPSSPWPSR